MAFTEEEVKAFNPQALAEERVRVLMERHQVAHRRSELQVDKAAWWRKAADKILDVVSWYCHAMQLPGVDREEARTLPAPSSAEGKRLTKEALNLEAADFLGEWADEAEACMRHGVTLGRRAVGKGAGKAIKSASNKLANCVIKELNLTQHLEKQLDSMSG